jgi:DNA-binding response OmpR family regulator
VRASPPTTLAVVTDILLATDADWIFDEVAAALAEPGTTIRRVRRGYDVLPAAKETIPDLVLIDMQIGNMGGIATTLAIRLETTKERLPYLPVLLLLDRDADIFLAQRAQSDGWLFKPLDAFRLRRAAEALLGGGQYEETPRLAVP